jgi:hypothetical protein
MPLSHPTTRFALRKRRKEFYKIENQVQRKQQYFKDGKIIVQNNHVNFVINKIVNVKPD